MAEIARKCEKCGKRKPIDEFPPVCGGRWRSRTCRPCTTESKRRHETAVLADAVLGERRRAQHRKSTNKWRRGSPEAYLKAQRRYRAKVYASTEKHAAFLEARRLAHRLKREREGLPVRPVGWHKKRNGKRIKEVRRIDPKPLVELVESLVGEDMPIEDVCERLEISSRRFRAWRAGEENIGIGLAERAIDNAGVEFADLYPELA